MLTAALLDRDWRCGVCAAMHLVQLSCPSGELRTRCRRWRRDAVPTPPPSPCDASTGGRPASERRVVTSISGTTQHRYPLLLLTALKQLLNQVKGGVVIAQAGAPG